MSQIIRNCGNWSRLSACGWIGYRPNSLRRTPLLRGARVALLLDRSRSPRYNLSRSWQSYCKTNSLPLHWLSSSQICGSDNSWLLISVLWASLPRIIIPDYNHCSLFSLGWRRYLLYRMPWILTGRWPVVLSPWVSSQWRQWRHVW